MSIDLDELDGIDDHSHSTPDDVVETTKVLRRILGAPFLRFDRQWSQAGIVTFRLSGSDGVLARAGDVEYACFSFYESNNSRFWLSVDLDYRRGAGELRLQSASLVAFRGLLRTDDKEPLVRAEWDWLDIEDPQAHAQPHWHVYPSEREVSISYFRLFDGEGTEFEPVEEVEEFELDPARVTRPRRLVARLHLAMASSWHLGEVPGHCTEPKEGMLPRWIEGVVGHLREEFKLYSKLLPGSKS